tara:strand:- start:4020 stop:4451 length:432 start_codon:yes stop_codon:yes gene_type:complete
MSAKKKAKKKATKKVAKKATKKVAKKAKKKVAKKAKKKVAKTKRKPNPAFMKAMTPSDALAKIIGEKKIAKTDAVKKLWDYIKKNNLQNKKFVSINKKLELIFGKKDAVAVSEISKVILKHLGKDEKPDPDPIQTISSGKEEG